MVDVLNARGLLRIEARIRVANSMSSANNGISAYRVPPFQIRVPFQFAIRIATMGPS